MLYMGLLSGSILSSLVTVLACVGVVSDFSLLEVYLQEFSSVPRDGVGGFGMVWHQNG